MAFWLLFKFLFILCLIAIFFFVVIIFFPASYRPLFLPLSMNLWLWEKALKEGLARVNGGQLCQLLHPNEAALSFTKPQLITLQAISEQDCLSESLISPSPFPHNQQHNDETCGMKGIQTVFSLPWKQEKKDVCRHRRLTRKLFGCCWGFFKQFYVETSCLDGKRVFAISFHVQQESGCEISKQPLQLSIQILD